MQINHLRVGPNSSSPLTQVQKYIVHFTAPVMTSGVAEMAAESTYTVAGLTTGTVLMFTPSSPLNANYTFRPRCSTVNELVIAWGHFNDSTIGSGETTNHGVLLQFSF